MDNFLITATSDVSGEDVASARLGSRFGRMDLSSRLALLAVEKLGVNFDEWPRDRIALCLASSAGSLATDAEYWHGRDQAGGPSPTLFTYTLPSAPIGEIAIRHHLTGPSLCFITASRDELLEEAKDLLRRGEADACVCVEVEVVTAVLGELLNTAPMARARAMIMKRASPEGLNMNSPR